MGLMLGKPDVAIGNAAGWALAFGTDEDDAKPLVLSSQDYYAEVEAELPGDLKGGVYKFTVEGLIDEHYARLVKLQHDESLGVVRLYLFWIDANESVAGYLANAFGLSGLVGALDQSALTESLVATLAITRVARKLGPRRYDTVVEARELVYHRLAARRPTPLVADSYRKAVDDVASAADVSITAYLDLPAPSGAAPGTEDISLAAGTTNAAALEQIAKSVEQAAGKAGRGLTLIRDGILHFGVRPIPLDGGDAKPLTLRTGLLETELAGVVIADPNHDVANGPTPYRRQFKLTLKGRPDLKPGDLIAFSAPEGDVGTTLPGVAQAVLGSLAGDVVQELDAQTLDTTLYVTSVQHRLGRTAGFSTVLVGVQVKDAGDAWDQPTPSGTRAATAGVGTVGARSSGSGQLAHGITKTVQAALISEETLEVGEVRATHTSGTKEPPSQTVTVYSGLAAADGRPNQARRLDVERAEPRSSAGAPYLTPFAWGKAGLVLPRYPGTRVAIAYRHNQPNDPIELGALWQSGHGPKSEPGDWWLILPADKQNVKTADLTGSATAKEPNDFHASNDLIDAAGDRFIEVGRLTIRVGAGGLKNAGERPKDGTTTEYVAIEHEDGETKIVIDKNGNITLTAAQTLTLEANKVEVRVGSDGMDVVSK